MAKKKQVKIFEFEGKQITFDFGDGEKMINATEMAKVFGKRLQNFARLKQTKDFIQVLKSDSSHVSDREIIRIVKGGRQDLQGTWYCDILALKLAAWLSPQFEVWIYAKITELLTTGKAQLTSSTIEDKELLFYLTKIADNNLEASQLAVHIIKRKKESE